MGLPNLLSLPNKEYAGRPEGRIGNERGLDVTTKIAALPRSAAEPSDLPKRRTMISREPMHEQVLPHIRRDIVEGRWGPGERLPEPLLCAEFGISRTPMRDALKILEAEGLVELVPHVGAVVTDPTQPDVAEKMEVLSALEQAAAAKVATTRPPAVLEQISMLHTRMNAAAHQHDPSTYYRLNDEFHRAIVLGADNKTLADMHEHIMWHVHRARHRANEYEKLSEGAAEHHDRIVRCLMSGDPNAAATAMKEHLHDVSDSIVGHLDHESE